MRRGRFLPENRSTRIRLGVVTGAAAVTAAAVGIGVLAPGAAPEPTGVTSASNSISGALGSTEPRAFEDRTIGTSRSSERVPAVRVQSRTPSVKRKLWTYAPLKLRVQPGEDARDVGIFPEDRRIDVTGERQGGYAEVIVDDRARWVSAAYLNTEKQPEPEPIESGSIDSGDSDPDSSESGASVDSGDSDSGSSESGGIDTGACANGAVASGGLQPSAQTVMNAVCNAFPSISTYGGAAGRGEHGTGLAIDIMVSGSEGEQVKQFLYSNRGQFGLSNIIHAQNIWSAERDSEGFRGMEDRGSTTANHYDHVHVLAY